MFDRAGDTHLAIELLPQQGECRVWVVRKMAGLAALEVRVEGEPPFVEPAEQDVTRRWPAVGIGRRERDRVRQVDAFGLRVLEPPTELDHGIGGEVVGLEREDSDSFAGGAF